MPVLFTLMTVVVDRPKMRELVYHHFGVSPTLTDGGQLVEAGPVWDLFKDVDLYGIRYMMSTGCKECEDSNFRA